MARVYTADGRRLLFEGNRDDAEAFVSNNFPRMHVEPGVSGSRPDVYADNDGEKSFYVGGAWMNETELDDFLTAQDQAAGTQPVTATQLFNSMSAQERAQFAEMMRSDIAAHEAPVESSGAQPEPTAQPDAASVAADDTSEAV